MPKPQPKSEPPKTLHLGEVRYDLGRGELWRGREMIRLTATELMLMRIFAARAHEPVTRQELVEDLGGGIAEAQERAVDVQITRLRRKIEEDPKAPRYLQTVRLRATCWRRTDPLGDGSRHAARPSAQAICPMRTRENRRTWRLRGKPLKRLCFPGVESGWKLAGKWLATF